MRQPVTVTIPPHLIEQSQLYAPSRDATSAVCHILDDYPRRLAEARQLRSRLAQIDSESSDLDARTAELQRIARLIIDL
jgi:hypothetical protein